MQKVIRINQERLKNIFLDLVKIDSPSKEEGKISAFIREWFKKEIPETTILEDNSNVETGSEVGNLIVKIPGNRDAQPIFFNAHMDTVEPGRGVKPIFQDGIFKSDGTTILGADDKAAIAILMETAKTLKEKGIFHIPFEIILTTCEEIGLLGAKYLDVSLIDSKEGLALDSEDITQVINRAPSAIRFHVRINGVSAHAGLNPEKGISAIKIAASAISKAPQGRIDDETTCNIGLIKGGVATNIVPELVQVDGEVRSHNEKRLKEVQDEIISCFYKEVDAFKPEKGALYPFATVEVEDDYPLMHVPEENEFLKRILHIGDKIGRKLVLVRTGGGSDANILNKKGLTTLILGIGMQQVHTTEEFIRLSDMVATCELIGELLK